MNNRETENRIRKAVLDITPSYSDDLWDKPAEKADGSEWYLQDTQKRHTGFRAGALMLACTFILAFGFGYYSLFMKTFATLYLDVNPSVTLAINAREKVISVKADNEDAQVILGDMDLMRTDVDTAVNALLGSMIRRGYLDEAHDLVLLSMDCSDSAKGDVILTRLSSEMNEYLGAFLSKYRVIDQKVTVDNELDRLAEENEISPGKAFLIRHAAEEDDTLEFEELAHMTVEDLIRLLKDRGADIEDVLDELDDYFDEDGEEQMIPEEDEDEYEEADADHDDAEDGPDEEYEDPDDEDDDDRDPEDDDRYDGSDEEDEDAVIPEGRYDPDEDDDDDAYAEKDDDHDYGRDDSDDDEDDEGD